MNFIATSRDITGKVHDRYFCITNGDDAECFVYDSSSDTIEMYPDMSIVNEIVPGAKLVILQTNKRIMMQMVIK